MTIGHLCNKQLVSGGNMTLVIDNLEKRDWQRESIARRIDVTIVVQLTPKGRELFDKIFVRHAEFVAELTSVLSKDEITQLSNLLKKLGTGIE
jgi:MarR family 2-MHQ and catechol resistance regulon transcriptional repressor